jgi:hypothetical protein
MKVEKKSELIGRGEAYRRPVGGADSNHSQKAAPSFLFLALWLKLTAETVAIQVHLAES